MVDRVSSDDFFDDVSSAIASVRDGGMVVVVDDADRENEGDLILSAHHVTESQVAFMIRYTSGIVCAPMTASDASHLGLSPMVSENNAPLRTAFTVSVDHRSVTTGISARERCLTLRSLADSSCGADDFVRPGHIFPLIAREGGVLMRSGHTEAAVDLCALADLPTIGVLAELVNDDGTVKKGEEVYDFAHAHGLRMISVASLIQWRQRREVLIERVEDCLMTTPIGGARLVHYRTPFDSLRHMAVIFGDLGDGRHIRAYLHRETIAEDVFGSGSVVRHMLSSFSDGGGGVFIYLREGAVGVLADDDFDSRVRRHDASWRDIGLGAQILRDLGISSIRLMASKERHYVGLDGFGITIDETILI